ncbi:MAG TPA: SPFH domain-containing protein [Acidimicrobiales bacterium]|nr:SPFH domain-containing protein [Acidimicrobiales bacterium]
MRNETHLHWLHPLALRPVARGRRFVLAQWERGVLFHDGRLAGVLEAGAHRRWGRGFALRRVDTRPWILQVPTQEVPTADGLTVKVTIVGKAKVVDPVAFVTASQDANTALYLSTQIATREVVGATTVEQLLAARTELGDALTAAVRGLDELGVAMERLELKDVIFSGELKKAQAEVLVARAQGLAALERARGETAALRNLANAAGLLKDNPALLQLRLVQQLAATSGHTVVIGQAPLGA